MRYSYLTQNVNDNNNYNQVDDIAFNKDEYQWVIDRTNKPARFGSCRQDLVTHLTQQERTPPVHAVSTVTSNKSLQQEDCVYYMSTTPAFNLEYTPHNRELFKLLIEFP